MSKNKKHFYVYYSYESWGRGYIGKRECWCTPEEDIKYFGSFRDKTFKPTEKIILETFDSLEKVLQAEILLHDFYEVDKNSHFANRAKATSDRFCFSPLGIKRSEETKRKVSNAKKGTVTSEETKLKLKEKRKGRKPALGMKHTEKWKKDHSKRMLDNNPFAGKKHAEETRKIISEKTKGRDAPNKGKPHSEETKRKISEKRKQQCALRKLQQQSGGN
jgi:hypothetical protein